MPLSEGRKVGDYPISITVSPTRAYVQLLTASLIYSKSLSIDCYSLITTHLYIWNIWQPRHDSEAIHVNENLVNPQ